MTTFLEIELKLSIDANPAHISLLFNHPLLINLSPVSEELISRYFDTADLCLWKQGLSLRIRESEGHMIQTLKTAGQQLGELQHRQEWDQPIEDTLPNIHAFEDKAVSKKLETIIGDQPLAELFHTRFKRHNGIWKRKIVQKLNLYSTKELLIRLPNKCLYTKLS